MTDTEIVNQQYTIEQQQQKNIDKQNHYSTSNTEFSTSYSNTTTSDTTTDLSISTDSFISTSNNNIPSVSSFSSSVVIQIDNSNPNNNNSGQQQPNSQNGYSANLISPTQSNNLNRVNSSGAKTYPLHESAYKGEYDRLVSLILFIQGKVNSLKSPSNSPQGMALRNHNHHYPHISQQSISAHFKSNPHPQPDETNASEFTGVNSLDEKFTTALHHAAFNGHKQCVKLLLASGAYPDVKDVDGCTPLHNAAFNGYRSVILLLIECGANVNSNDIDLNTALHKCTFSGHHKCAELLIEHGCDIEAKDSHGITPLLKSAVNKHFKCLSLLLDKGADVNSKDNSNTTALHQACYKGSDRCVSLLISKGADINCYDKEGYTPLHNAVYNGFEECSRILLDKGANIDQRALDGCSPLHYAASNGSEACLSLLIRRGCKLDITDVKRGRTALHYAASKGHLGCVEILLKAGADSGIQDYSNKIPKNLTQNHEIITLLSSMVEVTKTRRASSNSRSSNPSSSKHKHTLSNTSSTPSTPPQTPPTIHRDLNSPTQPNNTLSQSQQKQQPSLDSSMNGKHLEASTNITSNGNPLKQSTIKSPVLQSSSNNNNISTPSSPSNTNQSPVNSQQSPNNENSSISRTNSNESITSTKSTISTTTNSNNNSNNNNNNSSSDIGSPEIKPKLDIYGFVKTSNGGGSIEEVRTKKLEKREKFWIKLIKDGLSLKKSSLAHKVREKLPKGIPSSVRGCVWQRLVNTTEIKNKSKITYKELLEKTPAPAIAAQINRDLNRTFPKHSLFIEKDGMGQQILCNILTAFSIYNPDVGYCQGMGFITCLLMIYMAEEDAFWGLVQLSEKYGMADMWKPDFPYLQTSFGIFDQLLTEIFPNLFNHLQKQNVFTPLYSPQWFICLLIYNLPFPLIIRIWDLFLYDGLIIIFAACLALFKMHEDIIMKMEFEEIVNLLKFSNGDKEDNVTNKIDISTLMKHIVHYRSKIKHVLKDPSIIKDPNESNSTVSSPSSK